MSLYLLHLLIRSIEIVFFLVRKETLMCHSALTHPPIDSLFIDLSFASVLIIVDIALLPGPRRHCSVVFRRAEAT